MAILIHPTQRISVSPQSQIFLIKEKSIQWATLFWLCSNITSHHLFLFSKKYSCQREPSPTIPGTSITSGWQGLTWLFLLPNSSYLIIPNLHVFLTWRNQKSLSVAFAALGASFNAFVSNFNANMIRCQTSSFSLAVNYDYRLNIHTFRAYNTFDTKLSLATWMSCSF